MPVIITCKDCGRVKEHEAHGLCKYCYAKTRKVVYKDCGRLMINTGHGLCAKCYRRAYPRIWKKAVCKGCGKFKDIRAKGMCLKCYCRIIANPRMKNDRLQRRKDLIEMLGGKCTHCGYDKNPSVLTFHHPDSTKKEISLAGSRLNWSMKRLIAEASKCILLCHNCHHELHHRNRPIIHSSTFACERRTMKLLHYRCNGDIRCMRCGYDRHPVNLVFHHRDPTTKWFSIGWAISRPKKIGMNLMRRETLKCDVLCHNCHYEIHYPKTGQAPHVRHCTQTSLSEFDLSPIEGIDC